MAESIPLDNRVLKAATDAALHEMERPGGGWRAERIAEAVIRAADETRASGDHMSAQPELDYDAMMERSSNDEAALRVSHAMYDYLFGGGDRSLRDEAFQPLLNDWAIVTGNNKDWRKKQAAEDGENAQSCETAEPDALHAEIERKMALQIRSFEQQRRDELRSAARELLSRAHINLSQNLTITGGGHGRTITATFNTPVGEEVPTIAGINISVRFGWATCDDALRGLDAVLTVITTALDDARAAIPDEA